MRPMVAEPAVARLVAGAPGRPLLIAPRSRRRGRWGEVAADAALAVLHDAGPRAVVLARDVGIDPGARSLPALGRLVGVPVLRLPADAVTAAWAVGLAVHPDLEERGLVRRVECVLGALARCGRTHPPVLRPRLISRWAARAWRPCDRCAGGGPAAGRCGRCGAAMAGGGG